MGECFAQTSCQNALTGFKRPVAWHASGPARRRACFCRLCPPGSILNMACLRSSSSSGLLLSALSSREHLEHGVPQVLVVGLAPVGFDVLIERVRSGPSMAANTWSSPQASRLFLLVVVLVASTGCMSAIAIPVDVILILLMTRFQSKNRRALVYTSTCLSALLAASPRAAYMQKASWVDANKHFLVLLLTIYVPHWCCCFLAQHNQARRRY